MKWFVVLFSFASSFAFATTYQCNDGGVLQIGNRNKDGYSRASMVYMDGRRSDLGAIWFTSSPESRIGTLLSDEAEELGVIEVADLLVTIKTSNVVVTCTK